MRKVVIGCLVMLVVTAIGAGVVTFWLYRKVAELGQTAQSYVTELSRFGEIAEADKRIANTASFTPPAANDLTPSMVNRFVQVQESMQKRLGTRAEDLKKKKDDLDTQMKASGRQVSHSDTFSAVKDLIGIIVDAKKAQVDALNAAGFSLAEYSWVRGRIYEAAGLSVTGINLEELTRGAAGGTDTQVERPRSTSGASQHNQDLVKPHIEKLKEWMPFAWVGL